VHRHPLRGASSSSFAAAAAGPASAFPASAIAASPSHRHLPRSIQHAPPQPFPWRRAAGELRR
jgi:hypothetical protein